MNPLHADLFEWRGEALQCTPDALVGRTVRIPIQNGIPRFVRDSGYVSNFGLLREKHARLQLDSANGTRDRHDTLLSRTNWPPEFFQGKTVLECGCGAGPDTEVLLDLGANVVSVDMTGVDAARTNVHSNPDATFVQASILDLPFRKNSFDIVFCHRVLQHTPQPRDTLACILQFAKPGGAAFVHSYARTWRQLLRWKYALRPLAKRLPQEMLYKAIRFYAPALFALTSRLNTMGRYGQRFTYAFIPLLNYSHRDTFANRSREFMYEYAIHDTFDALSPRYDRPISARAMRSIGNGSLTQPFEVVEHGAITLLRTLHTRRF